MIVIFHYFTKILYDLLNRHLDNSWKYFTLTKKSPFPPPWAQRDAENDIKFDPPVFKQRYERVTDILTDEKWHKQIEKLVEFGCAEFRLFVFLKNTLEAREINFVDIDELLLRDYLYRVYPLNADYLVGRTKPLNLKVFVGSIADPDPSLSNTDAVVGIEIIEHLYPDTLEAVPYNIFSHMKPKIAIFTTPNSEFNILFKKVDKFRHADHKFEWTREQFQSWADNITQRFPQYTVKFDGIGLGPERTEHLGCCSQLALFIRKDVICDNFDKEINVPCTCLEGTCKSLDCSSGIRCCCECERCRPLSSYGICTFNSCSSIPQDGDQYYKLLARVDYPCRVDCRSEEEKVLDELKYRIQHVFEQRFFNSERERSEIPISVLVFKGKVELPAEEDVRNLLVKNGYQIEECPNQETDQVESCVIYESVMEKSGSGSETDASGYESDRSDNNACADEDKDKEGARPPMRLEVTDAPRPEALIDSGYQNDSPPQASRDPIPLEYKSLNSVEKPNKLSNILSVFDNFDKVNELDAMRRDRRIFNFPPSNLPHKEIMRKICREIAKHPVAGPSSQQQAKKRPNGSESDESTTDEVRSIATCIIENSLNRIQCRDEEEEPPDLIQELMPPPLEVAAIIVENGDLANNNRDNEGNNYPPDEEEGAREQEQGVDVDNVERNNNEMGEEGEGAAAAAADENLEIEPLLDAVEGASREALYDVNSQVDLLEDFDMDASACACTLANVVAIPQEYVVVIDVSTIATDPAALPAEEDNQFPHWLLQMFDDNEPAEPEDDLHDEPHFYCQGDGLGVHPSTVAVNDDDDDDEDDEGNGSASSSSSSSSSSSVDFANAENSSSVPEVFLTPDESRNDDEDLVVVGQQVVAGEQNASVASSEQEEVFENAEESESNLIPSFCTE